MRHTIAAPGQGVLNGKIAPARFAGAYGGVDARTIALGQITQEHPEVFTALQEALASTPAPAWLLREDSGVLVYPARLQEVLQNLSKRSTLRDVQKALRAICRETERANQRKLDGAVVRFWRIDPQFLPLLEGQQ